MFEIFKGTLKIMIQPFDKKESVCHDISSLSMSNLMLLEQMSSLNIV